MFSLLQYSSVDEESKRLSLTSPVCSISSDYPDLPSLPRRSPAPSISGHGGQHTIKWHTFPLFHVKPFFWNHTLNVMHSPCCAWVSLPFPPSPPLTPLFHPTNHLSTRPTCITPPPHFSPSLSRCLPLSFLSGCLIKGALSNEITPWGLMVWLIDRHTAGED